MVLPAGKIKKEKVKDLGHVYMLNTLTLEFYSLDAKQETILKP